MASRHFLWWTWTVAIATLTSVTGCGNDRSGAQIAGPDGEGMSAVGLAKPAGKAASGHRAVVVATVTRDGTPVEGVLAFSRSVSGLPLDYRWTGTTGSGGVAEIEITPDGRMDVAGYYQGVLNNDLSAEQLGHEFGREARYGYMYGRASTIYGGSNEVQKNVIAKAVLGL